jgi:hypothetical protein
MYGSASLLPTSERPLLGQNLSQIRPYNYRTAENLSLSYEPSLFQQHEVALEEENRILATYGETHWKYFLYRLLQSHRTIIALALLMLLDVLFLVIGLVLEGTYPECSTILPRLSCSSCMIVLTDKGETMDCGERCEESPQSIQNLKLFLTSASILILFVFLVELGLHLLALGIRGFVKNGFLVLDLVVVLVSLWIESLTSLSESDHESPDDVQVVTMPLLILSRSWRLLRIGHGAYVEAHQFYESRIKELELDNAELKQRLQSFNVQ